MLPTLNRRLLAAAAFVRQGSVLADVGTDHAYLPVYLISKGISVRAIAADINQGPIKRAEQNIASAGLASAIETRLTDGLLGLDRLGITDIAICGMGGELISKILEDAPFTASRDIRLILQPMTKADLLRSWLLSHGYEIVDESIVRDDRIYQVICAEYSGINTEYSPIELLLGRHNINGNSALLCELAGNTLAAMTTKRNGRSSAGLSTEEEDRIILELSKILKNRTKNPKGLEI